ncbi:MAG: hypothetical protein ABI430_00365 [Candidatus Taylorbacteria bacterium]
MKSHKIMITLIALLIIIAAIGWISTRPSLGNPKVISVETYTAPDGGFSFQYPEFEGWKSSIPSDGNIYFSVPFESVVAPSIKISRNYQSSPIALPDRLPTNPNGITYTNYDVKIGYLSFIGSSISTPQSKTEVVEISVPLPSPYDEQNSYSAKKMADMIIKTFVFKKSKVIETRDSSCSNMTGFTFRYPIFFGWEVMSVEDHQTKNKRGYECVITLNSPNKELISGTRPTIVVSKYPYSENDFEIPSYALSNPNPNKIPYTYMKEETSGADIAPNHFAYAVFFGENNKFFVDVDGLSEKTGFPVDEFFTTVIATFKITKE